MQLAEWQDRFESLGVRVAAMSYDDVNILAAFHTEAGLGYPLLSDRPGHRHVREWGILNEQYDPGHRAYGVPHPGIAFIDARGVVQLAFAVPDYRDRPPFADVHVALADWLKANRSASLAPAP